MYLLDTHVLLWWLMDDSRLSNRARAILKDPECLIWVSAASIWEIFIKKNLGKLDVTSELEEVIDASGFLSASNATSFAIGLPALAIQISSPCVTLSSNCDKWVLAS